jgi:hypothetical protein
MKTAEKPNNASNVRFAAGHAENKKGLPSGLLKRSNQEFALPVKPMKRSMEGKPTSQYRAAKILHNQQIQTENNVKIGELL